MGATIRRLADCRRAPGADARPVLRGRCAAALHELAADYDRRLSAQVRCRSSLSDTLVEHFQLGQLDMGAQFDLVEHVLQLGSAKTS